MLDGSTSTKDASFEQAPCRKAGRRGSIPRAAEQSATLVRTCRSHIGGPGMFLEVARPDECKQDYTNAAGSNPGPCSHECVLRKQAKQDMSCLRIVVEVSQHAKVAGGCNTRIAQSCPARFGECSRDYMDPAVPRFDSEASESL